MVFGPLRLSLLHQPVIGLHHHPFSRMTHSNGQDSKMFLPEMSWPSWKEGASLHRSPARSSVRSEYQVSMLSPLLTGNAKGVLPKFYWKKHFQNCSAQVQAPRKFEGGIRNQDAVSKSLWNIKTEKKNRTTLNISGEPLSGGIGDFYI